MVEPRKETKQGWKEDGKELFWNCPLCDDVEMVQYRVEDENPGRALCPECLTVFAPAWDVVEPGPAEG